MLRDIYPCPCVVDEMSSVNVYIHMGRRVASATALTIREFGRDTRTLSIGSYYPGGNGEESSRLTANQLS